MLNEAGGIETDLTVICIEKDHFRIISSAASRTHYKALVYFTTNAGLERFSMKGIMVRVFVPSILVFMLYATPHVPIHSSC